MGEEDVPASIASVVLAIVAGQFIGRAGGNYSKPLMHLNLCVHGIIGLLHYQSGAFGVDTSKVFPISVAAAKCLSMGGLNADCYQHAFTNKFLSLGFVLIGIIPVYMEIIGKKNDPLTHGVVLINIIALIYNGVKHNNEYSYFTAGMGAIAGLGQTLIPAKCVFPLALAAMDFFSTRVGYTSV